MENFWIHCCIQHSIDTGDTLSSINSRVFKASLKVVSGDKRTHLPSRRAAPISTDGNVEVLFVSSNGLMVSSNGSDLVNHHWLCVWHPSELWSIVVVVDDVVDR